MDLDKSLLELGEPTFRLYSWKPNSFTIGRSQIQENIEKFGNDWAKRETGGGLLFHGGDVSYSITTPIDFLKNKSVKESYEYLCKFLLDFYRKLGLHVEYAKDIDLKLSKSFFCQEGFEPYDMIIKGKKIGGNAQRRTKNTILQHGSIPLTKDNREFAGHALEEFNINLTQNITKELLKNSFEETFGVKFEK